MYYTHSPLMFAGINAGGQNPTVRHAREDVDLFAYIGEFGATTQETAAVMRQIPTDFFL